MYCIDRWDSITASMLRMLVAFPKYTGSELRVSQIKIIVFLIFLQKTVFERSRRSIQKNKKKGVFTHGFSYTEKMNSSKTCQSNRPD